MGFPGDMARAAFTCCHPPSPLLPGSEQTGSPVASTLRLLAAPRPRDGDSAESPGLSRLRVQLSDPRRLHRPVGGGQGGRRHGARVGPAAPGRARGQPSLQGVASSCPLARSPLVQQNSFFILVTRQAGQAAPPRPHTQVFAPGSPAPLRVPPPEPTHVATNPPPTLSILSFRDNQRAPNARGVGTPTLPG